MNLAPWLNLIPLSIVPAVLIALGSGIGVVYLFFSGAFTRARRATTDYEGTLVGNVNALKDRVALLERWRDEATLLDKRVRDLEEAIRQTAAQHSKELGERDLEIENLRIELAKARADMAAAHAKIRRLEKTLSPVESEKDP